MTTKTQNKGNKKNNRAVLSVHTKLSTSVRLEKLAESMHSTKSALANEALESFLDNQEWVVGEIKKGLADVKAGRVIKQAEMLEWAKSLKVSK